MGEAKRRLRWFERRVAGKQDSANLWKKVTLPDQGTFIRVAFLALSVIALGTVILAGFSITIPSELRIMLDRYLVSGLFFESLIDFSIAAFIARLTLPIIAGAIFFAEARLRLRWLDRNIRAVYAWVWRNGFQASAYTTLLVGYAVCIFLIISFGLVFGFLLAMAYVAIVSVCVLLFTLGDFLSYLLSRKERQWWGKFVALEREGPPDYVIVLMVLGFVSVSGFCFGLGVSVKRHLELVSIEIGSNTRLGAIIAVTEFGLIVHWSDELPADGGQYSFLPHHYKISSLH